MLVRLICAFVLMGLTITVSSASADQQVNLVRASEISERDWKAILRYYESDAHWETVEDVPTSSLFFTQIAEAKTSPSETIEIARHNRMWVGYADVDGDGVDEMFVVPRVSGSSGTSGYHMEAFRRNADQWEEFAGFNVYVAAPGASDIYITDQSRNGRRTFYGPQTAYEWDGKKYKWKPIWYCQFCPDIARPWISDEDRRIKETIWNQGREIQEEDITQPRLNQ